MSKIYNKPFKIGVLFSLLTFTLCNLYAFLIAYKKNSDYLSSGNKIFVWFPDWGIPFHWNETYFGIILSGGGILNLVILAICCFIFGFLFKFAWSKISDKELR